MLTSPPLPPPPHFHLLCCNLCLLETIDPFFKPSFNIKTFQCQKIFIPSWPPIHVLAVLSVWVTDNGCWVYSLDELSIGSLFVRSQAHSPVLPTWVLWSIRSDTWVLNVRQAFNVVVDPLNFISPNECIYIGNDFQVMTKKNMMCLSVTLGPNKGPKSSNWK